MGKERVEYQVGDIIREELSLMPPNPPDIEVFHYLILEETEDPEDEMFVVMLLETSDVFKITFHTGPTLKHKKVG